MDLGVTDKVRPLISAVRAMVLGFATTYPVNWLLIAKGVKEKM